MTADQWKSSEEIPSEATLTQSDNATSVVFLKAVANSLKTAEQFLKNRGMIIYSTHQLREALAFIIQKHPSIVFIAADHPNKKVRSLPKLLNQAFQLTIVGFTESHQSESISLLQQLGMEYILYPPISGPAIERMILKIQKDAEERPKAESRKLMAQGANANSEVIESSTFDAAKVALNHLISDLGSDEAPNLTETGNHPKGSELIIQKGTVGEKINYNPQEAQQQGSSVATQPGHQSQAMAYMPEPGSSRPPGQIDSGDSGSFVGNWVPTPSETKKSELPIVPSPSAPSKKRAVSNFGDSDSIIVKGTQVALEETTDLPKADAADINQLDAVSNIACLAIESSRFSGYLVAALGNDRKIDQEFMTQIRDRLFTFLRNHGEFVDEGSDPIDLRMEKIEFQEWALNQAEFLRKSIHGSDEIAMAFFPTEDTRINLEKSARDNMVKMAIDDIRDDKTVDFDVYIYLPENEKFLLYVAERHTLSSLQKDRLKKKGVTHIHLRKEKVHEVKRYKARLFLGDKIELFKNSAKN